MANYHFETKIISRGKGGSVTGAVSYICGRTLRDSYNGRTYYNHRLVGSSRISRFIG